MERLLGAARELSGKVETNESAAGDLLRQCESLQEELRAMRQVGPGEPEGREGYRRQPLGPDGWRDRPGRVRTECAHSCMLPYGCCSL